jgi:hypothetical protein
VETLFDNLDFQRGPGVPAGAPCSEPGDDAQGAVDMGSGERDRADPGEPGRSSRLRRRLLVPLGPPTANSPPQSSHYSGPRPINPKSHSDWTTRRVPLMAATAGVGGSSSSRMLCSPRKNHSMLSQALVAGLPTSSQVFCRLYLAMNDSRSPWTSSRGPAIPSKDSVRLGASGTRSEADRHEPETAQG